MLYIKGIEINHLEGIKAGAGLGKSQVNPILHGARFSLHSTCLKASEGHAKHILFKNI